MAQRGKIIALVIGIYLVAKSLLNLLIGGFSAVNIATLVLMGGLAAILNLRVRHAHFITSGLCIVIALYYLPGNLTGFPGTWLYLTEALLDIGSAAVLFASPDVRAFMEENKSE